MDYEETPKEAIEKFDWYEHLDERQIKEVELARSYVDHFNHGTTGHNQLVLIAKMADLLDQMMGMANEL